MNQAKIGKFINECRKEKGLTQNQLAEKLGITDKAVSKWETGKGLPDAAIMIALCDQLGISVNELLSGERLTEDNYEEKANENIVTMAKAADKNRKRVKWNRIFSRNKSKYRKKDKWYRIYSW